MSRREIHSREDDDEPRTHERWTDTTSWLTRGYWTARGVIPRWQLFGVYLLIAGVGVLGFYRIGAQADEIGKQADRAESLSVQNRSLALEVKRIALSTKNDRDASIRASCERNSASVDVLILGSNRDQQTAPTPQAAAEVRRRRKVTLGLLSALRPVGCKADPRLPPAPKRSPGPSPTPIATP